MAGLRKLPSGKWQATVRLPNGKRTTHTAKLLGEAKAWAAAEELRIRRGSWRDPKLAKVSFDDWWARWSKARVAEAHTIRGDKSSVERITKRFSGRHVAAIGRVDVQAWIKQMQDAGTGPSAIRRAYNLLRACLTAALDEGIIDASPCRRIVLPRTDPRPPRWFTHAEVDAIRRFLKEPHKTMVALMCWAGLRWEEAAGLRVCDVDWIRGRVSVIGVIVGSTGAWREYPKNSASRAEVPAPKWVIEEMSALVAGRPRDALIFVTPRGSRPLTQANWNRMWRAALKAAKVAYRSPHTCRHTCASWLVQAGVPLYDVSRQLRHSTITQTQKYSHLAPGSQAQIVDAWKFMAHQRRTEVKKAEGHGA